MLNKQRAYDISISQDSPLLFSCGLPTYSESFHFEKMSIQKSKTLVPLPSKKLCSVSTASTHQNWPFRTSFWVVRSENACLQYIGKSQQASNHKIVLGSGRKQAKLRTAYGMFHYFHPKNVQHFYNNIYWRLLGSCEYWKCFGHILKATLELVEKR